MSKRNYDHLIKLMLIGDSAVGKSSLLIRFSDKAFVESFIPTIGVDFKIKTLKINDKTIKLQIWDTAGQERFNSITYSYYRGSMGIILVYDITNSRSFYNLSKWIRNIQDNADPDVLKLVVGNKCDREDLRVIPYNHAKELAEQNGMDFIETSAKNDINVEKAFYDLTKKIFETRFKENLDMNETKIPDQRNQGFNSVLSFPTMQFDLPKANCC